MNQAGCERAQNMLISRCSLIFSNTDCPKDHPELVDGSDYSYFFFMIKAIILKLRSLSHEPMSGSCLGHILLLSVKIAESHRIGL